MKSIIPIALLIILLCSCSSKPNQDIAQPPTLSTATVAITMSAQPTATRTPSPTMAISTIQNTSTPDADTLRIQVVATKVSLYQNCHSLLARDSGSEISPNGQWLTLECSGKDFASDSLQVVSIQADTLWNIYYGDYIKSKVPTEDIYPMHWSGDGKYLFAIVSSGNEGCCFLGNDLSLIRLDLNSGKQEEIVSYPNISDSDGGVVGVNFSISPGDRYALYIPQDRKNNLYILDLITHELRVVKIRFENTGAGFTLMSNDGKNVVLMLMEYPPTPQPDDPFLTYGSIVVINLETGLQRRLLSGMTFDDTPMPFRWTDDNNVELRNNGHVWLLNIHTQELTRMDPP